MATPPDRREHAGPVIEPMEPGRGPDVRSVAALLAVSWKGRSDQAETDRRADALAAELASLDPAAKRIFVATKSGRPVGFCRVLRDAHRADQWWLAGVVTHPAHRREGIGGALVRQGVEYARARGALDIRSETHVGNHASVHFHAALGFRSEGRFVASDGDEKIGFRLSLRAC